MSYRVRPVPGVFVLGVPAVVTEVATQKEAAALVATGAFTHAAPRRAAATPKRAKRSRAKRATAAVAAAPSEPEPADVPAAAEPQEA